jgi:hypothetical protein
MVIGLSAVPILSARINGYDWSGADAKRQFSEHDCGGTQAYGEKAWRRGSILKLLGMHLALQPDPAGASPWR